MSLNKSEQSSPLANELFEARELVDYAKCVLANLDLLRAFERMAQSAPAKVEVAKHFTPQQQAILNDAHNTGRFLEMRRLHPGLTDEGVENRIARILKRINGRAVVPDQYPGSLCLGRPQKPQKGTDDDLNGNLPELLGCLGDMFLCEGNDGSIRVRTRLLEAWQDLVLVVPPLLITSAWMAQRLDLSDVTPSADELQRAVVRINAWLCDSTLPVDDDPFLDHLCRTEGLDETHMHLNGTTEAEKVWFDALERPDQVVGGLTAKTIKQDIGIRVAIGNGVKRLLQQEDPDLSPERLMLRTQAAAALKARLLNRATSRAEPTFAEPPVAAYRRAQEHCMQRLSSRTPKVVKEAWQLIALFKGFDQNRMDHTSGLLFWHYALLRAQFCRLLIQQADQKGFDQFQSITLNELREATEKDYAERFRQIERGQQKGVDFLEGRFTPKMTPDDSAKLLGLILRGYLEFLGEGVARPAGVMREAREYRSLSDLLSRVRRLEKGDDQWPGISPEQPGTSHIPSSSRRLRLGLVPHFVKQSDKKERESFFTGDKLRAICRDAKVRRESDQRARALVALIQRTPGLETLIRGIDAASNERHAGPEVFAPVFRRMRHAGIRRFTYHAGEDFGHIVSGIRAIHEAVVFLDFDAGCRIGHGTASGLDPKAWWQAVSGYVVMPAEERLDDLVFAREMLLSTRTHIDSLPLIEAEIQRLSMKIWNDPRITSDLLAESWKLRSLDPLAQNVSVDDVDPNRRFEARCFANARQGKARALTHFLRRHGIDASSEELKAAREDVVVSRENDVLRPKVIRAIQNAVLRLLRERSIAIETLPSSNLRISIHKRYNDHHARNWLGLGKHPADGPVSVVIGSDDPGIFATGLRLEYAHLSRMLHAHVMSPESAKELLRRMCAEAKQFRF
ncbi:adenosine deaminase [Pseudomonas syringae]|uniref:adenosine deaminase n=1 Tax=Pseudomonas syringae TaxID=317 RepID=A0A3T0JQG6_PSESX|nr:adenosine deaminase [Pseudomonas syringae]